MKRMHFLNLLLLCGLPGASFAQVNIDFDNNPQLSHHDGSYFLRIPFIDQVGGIPALWQDAAIQYSPQTKTWNLLSYYKATPIAETEISAVDVIVTDKIPAQVFLEVTGRIVGCTGVGEVGVRQLNNAFTVYLFHSRGRDTALCVGNAFVDYREVVPMEVYGLAAGTYTYTVNGKFGGSFVLTADNVLE